MIINTLLIISGPQLYYFSIYYFPTKNFINFIYSSILNCSNFWKKKERKNLIWICVMACRAALGISNYGLYERNYRSLSLLYIIWTLEKVRNLRRLLDTWRVKAAAARDKRMSSLATRPLCANTGRLSIMRRPLFLSFSPSADLIANLIYYHEWNCPNPFFRAIRENTESGPSLLHRALTFR